VFVRPIGSEASQKLVGTEGAGRLFWSPNSRWIAFLAGGTLKKVEATGGPPQSICETPDLLGGTWNADDIIVFGSSRAAARDAAGGVPSLVGTASEASQQNHGRRKLLPDGKSTSICRRVWAGSIPRFAGSLELDHHAFGRGAIQRSARSRATFCFTAGERSMRGRSARTI
jgi:hypothetical protein